LSPEHAAIAQALAALRPENKALAATPRMERKLVEA